MKPIEDGGIVGIDGCPGGWIAIAYKNGIWQDNVFQKIDDLISNYPDYEYYLIDIPIGLTDAKVKRNIDSIVRKKLSPVRRSSVFTPPCREALSARNYQEANQINHEVMGKKISLQTWNISRKIGEVDNFLMNNRSYLDNFFEAHPELCFEGLNNGNALAFKKASPRQAGIKERMAILQKLPIEIDEALGWFDKYPRKLVRPDDLVDALGLCVTGILGSRNGFELISDEIPHDSERIPIRLIYFNGH